MKAWVPGELPLVAGAQELKEPGGREGIGRIGIVRNMDFTLDFSLLFLS